MNGGLDIQTALQAHINSLKLIRRSPQDVAFMNFNHCKFEQFDFNFRGHTYQAWICREHGHGCFVFDPVSGEI